MPSPSPLFQYPAPAGLYYIYCGRLRVGSIEAPGTLSLSKLLEGWLECHRISRAVRPTYSIDK